ncbi:MAG TPA: DNA polymerase Y family protein [Cyclobacteriaceae bacterium]|nr:DNA polymerase Y family protein [Cyclobacteriaceae bacterium]HMV09320.1 DNA polymerase Y family protein [Cyclobacteriaceae bacterium]HMX01879.1 DNA polymerase Y family protein [Cyclobacteriaceae bacterium]HMX50803.1 DNA polymerase Y family protein [Cyclobacteriaceae bacterium]HMY94703.1 DNA polymerase Y family protein [Cyclobacteriaceae bacterium]
MAKRFVSIWFRHLTTDWFTVRQPELKDVPFVLRAPSRGRMLIMASNEIAERKGAKVGMALADARAVLPELQALDYKPELIDDLLKRIAEWSIRFTPVVALDPPDGILLDVTGCSHLWGGDESYLNDIVNKFNSHGYGVSVAIADTIGVAWGVARFGKQSHVVPEDMHFNALLPLPPQALRVEPVVVDRLHKLGLRQVKQFINMPRASLRRRFGQHFMMRLNQAIGLDIEVLEPIEPIEPYQERLPCMEPISTLTGIEIALNKLLEALCFRLREDQKGLRTAIFKCYRIDGKVEQITIGTHRPSHYVKHLFKLFENKLSTIEPALGIELFVLEAPKVEDHLSQQEAMWEETGRLEDPRISELIDRIAGKVGSEAIHRYLPDEHYWPERSFKLATSLDEKPTTTWRSDKPRPLQILKIPERIEVTAPIPDYPPMLFIYKGKRHAIVKADGPERIEQEWWLQQGQHRDYYRVEDEEGSRYWLFRLGHYHDKTYQWFIHGFFA